MEPLLAQRSRPSLLRRANQHLRRARRRLDLDGCYEKLRVHDERAKRVLDLLAILLGLALGGLVLLALLLCCHALYGLAYMTAEHALGDYQVEITGVEASANFLMSPQDSTAASPPQAPPPTFNLTARVTNRLWKTKICVYGWQADVWYAGTPLGTAYFPDTCLEKMANATVKASTSRSELIGLAGEVERRVAAGQKSQGVPKLQIEMTHVYAEFKGRRNYLYRSPVFHWLWCDATVMDVAASPPSACRIHRTKYIPKERMCAK